MGKYPLQESVRSLGQCTKNIISKKADSGKPTQECLSKLRPAKPTALSSVEEYGSRRAEMEYYGEIMNYVFSLKSYPSVPSKTEKMKKDVQSLLREVIYLDGDEYMYEKCCDLSDEDKRAPFKSS